MLCKMFVAICLLSVFGLAQPASIFDLRPAIKSNDYKINGAPPIWKDCGKATDKFKLLSVEVTGCTAPPCILKKGTQAHVEIDFTAEESTANVTALVYGQIAGVDVPFPLTNSDACTCGVQCPTKVGTTYHYAYDLPVSKLYPSVECVVLWYLYDGENAEALCMSALVKIQ